MHQDLYSRKFNGDGAPRGPAWTKGSPILLKVDACFMNPAIQTAFDNFWKNTNSADGMGIQDHYANFSELSR